MYTVPNLLNSYILLGLRKTAAIKSGSVNLKEAAMNNQAWPASVIKASNNITNQFESPVIFYVLCLMAYGIAAVNLLSVSLAWLFVALRFMHAYIQTGSNYVPHRLRVFALSLLVILVFLIQIVINISGIYR